MHLRLSLLMFLEFAIMGAWVPVLTLHLKHLGFSAEESAWIFASNALGALLGPIIWGQIADRWVPAERCISLCSVLSGICLWLVAGVTEPATFFWSCFAFWLFLIPTLSLGASLTFRHLAHPEREFGRVRLWGTVGWITAGWILTAWYHICASLGRPHADDDWDDAFRWGALLAWALAAYAWLLPHTPPLSRNAPTSPTSHWFAAIFDAPRKAFQLFRHRSFLVLCLCLFGVYLTWPVNAQVTPLLLRTQGVPAEWLPLILSIAQALEVMTLAMLPTLLLRLGQKGTMTLGIIAWATALSILALSLPALISAASLALHGLFICCFLVAGQLYVNRLAQQDVRASAQGLMQLINGCGLLAGNLAVGLLRDWAGDDFSLVFRVGAFVAFGLIVVFAAGFEVHRNPSAPS